jgi:colanic acid biosynthesis glycosyl transferase WcaI
MKILIYSCHYAPEPIGIGKFTGETASWLAARGHQVRAVSAPPTYPQWRIADGYTGLWYRRELLDGVDVLRCPIWVSGGQSGLGRVLQYLSFSLSSAPAMIWRALVWKPDVIFTVIPPSSVMPAAIIGAAFAKATAWLHVQDFDIDAAFELNILKSPAFRAALLRIERWLMSRNGVVSSITPRMLDRLRAKQVTAELLELPNWADTESLYPIDGVSPLRAELGIAEDAFVALYSGNLGEKQGIDGLIDVARCLGHLPNVVVVICGDGAGRRRLANRTEGLTNVRLLPLQPLSRLNLLLNMADVHLLPQKSDVADLVMPSKLGGMLASGRPIVAGAAAGTQLAHELEQCGIVVRPDDAAAMADAVALLSREPGRRDVLGSAARRRAVEHWDKKQALLNFENHIQQRCFGQLPQTSGH